MLGRPDKNKKKTSFKKKMSRPYSFRTAAISHFLFWGDLKKKKKKQPLDALEKCSIASRALTLAYGILISQDGSFSENEFDVSSFKSELIYCRIIFFFSLVSF